MNKQSLSTQQVCAVNSANIDGLAVSISAKLDIWSQHDRKCE